MVEPIYVPVLPTRRDAWTAYEALDPLVRRRIAPLWTSSRGSGNAETWIKAGHIQHLNFAVTQLTDAGA
ncbi:hypothetical protein [Streptomyces sp. NPDC051677]|uniref:hypothetical protein n=1 Tax=Streptomyces sp. NPDC051677 TaxID=3365669 RepID=UPI0037D5D021